MRITESDTGSPFLASPAAADQFRADVLRGLRRPAKELPCKYFYDEEGSRLFEQICELEEYYLTRTELAIMQEDAGAMAVRLGPGCLLYSLVLRYERAGELRDIVASCRWILGRVIAALTPFADKTAAAKAGFDTSKGYTFKPFTPKLPGSLGAFHSFLG